MSESANDSGLTSKSSLENPAHLGDEKPLADDKSLHGDEERIENRDVEAIGEKSTEETAEKVNPRPGLSTLRWVVSLIALFLAAMLYGKP
jgi:hypothetical protein